MNICKQGIIHVGSYRVIPRNKLFITHAIFIPNGTSYLQAASPITLHSFYTQTLTQPWKGQDKLVFRSVFQRLSTKKLCGTDTIYTCFEEKNECTPEEWELL